MFDKFLVSVIHSYERHQLDNQDDEFCESRQGTIQQKAVAGG